MKIIIEICTDGAAFQENAGRELTRIFTILAADVWENARQLRDTNGNECGNVRTEE